MANVINFNGPQSASKVINTATLNGAMGKAHSKMDKAAARLGDKSEFHLNGAGYETRGKKFTNTVKTFAEASACVGAAAGTVLMVPVDLITGRGDARPEGEKRAFMDEGVLGHGGRFVTSLGSGACELVGAGVGGVGALVTYPARGAAKLSSAEWFEGGAAGGAVGGGQIGAHVLGAAVGTTLDVVRVPSLLTKVVFAGTFGALGGIVGAGAGVIRAATNR